MQSGTSYYLALNSVNTKRLRGSPRDDYSLRELKAIDRHFIPRTMLLSKRLRLIRFLQDTESCRAKRRMSFTGHEWIDTRDLRRGCARAAHHVSNSD